MKGKASIRVVILLAYLILTIGGKEVKGVKREESTSGINVNRQVNMTILVEGDVYDCVDVNLQPAFNHPLLKDHKIQMEPSSFPLGMYTKSPLVHDNRQAQLSTIDCPIGMIPILRNNRRNHVAVETIDEVIGKDKQQEVAGMQYVDVLYGTRAKINIFNPKVKNSKDLSASSIQINGLQGVGTSDGIAVGSIVNPNYSGDHFPRFHVTWVDGLRKTTCIDHDCGAFVQVSSSVGLGGRIKHISVYNGTQYEIDVHIFKDSVTKNWWVAYGKQDTPIGYWPTEIFHSMKDHCGFALWGGFVQGPTASSDSPQMGSGHFAYEGFRRAAFVRNIQIVDSNNKLVTPNKHKSWLTNTRVRKYSADVYDDEAYGLHIYYGGPGDFV